MRSVVQYGVLLALLLALLLSQWLTPDFDGSKRLPADTFNQLVPKQFNGWQLVADNTIPIGLFRDQAGERLMDNPYDDTLIRHYSNPKGQSVELAIAYGSLQRQGSKIHRPELCYFAQGFTLDWLKSAEFNFSPSLPAVKGQVMLVHDVSGHQLVSYWIRLGQHYPQSAWDTRRYLIKEGLQGEVPDGVLVRVSSKINRVELLDAELALHKDFLRGLILALDSTTIKPLLIR